MLYFKSELISNNTNYINIVNIVLPRLINHATHMKMKHRYHRPNSIV